MTSNPALKTVQQLSLFRHYDWQMSKVHCQISLKIIVNHSLKVVLPNSPNSPWFTRPALLSLSCFFGLLGQNDCFWHILVIYTEDFYLRGLEMSSWHLALFMDHLGKSLLCFSRGHVGPDEGFGDVWDIHASIVHDRGLEMSSWHLDLYMDHFDTSCVRFGGGHVSPDEGYWDVWDIHSSVVHDRGLEMSSWHLHFVQGSFWHILSDVWWKLCGSRWGLWRCLGHSCQYCSW